MKRPRLTAAVLATTLLAAPSLASAATEIESTTKTSSRDVTFQATGCSGSAFQEVGFDAGAKNIYVSQTEGTALYNGSREQVATISRIAVSGNAIRFTASGAGVSCDPARRADPWLTAPLTLTVRFDVQRTVLTKPTVIERGAGYCRSAASMSGSTASLKAAATLKAGRQRFSKIASALSTLKGRLAALKTPKADAAKFTRLLSAVESAKNRARSGSQAKTLARLRTLRTSYLKALTTASARAKAYGFTPGRGICG